jgi:molecular chaperone DnaJ
MKQDFNADYYQILGLASCATDIEIKTSFKRLAMKWHPDRCSDPKADDLFKQINHAYDVLSNPELRANYDVSRPQVHSSFVNRMGHGETDSFSDSQGASYYNRQPEWEKRGQAISDQCDVAIRLEQQIHGCVKEVLLDKTAPCPTCRGMSTRSVRKSLCTVCGGFGYLGLRADRCCHVCSGNGFFLESDCPTCQGSGVVKSGTLKHKIKIPPGLRPSQIVRLAIDSVSGKGNKAGNYSVKVRYDEHPLYQVDFPDLLLDMPLNILQLVTGGAIDFPTLNGMSEFNVKPGQGIHKPLRLPQEGLLDGDSGKTGDMIVNIRLVNPDGLSDSQVESIRKILSGYKQTGADFVAWEKKLNGWAGYLKRSQSGQA